MIGCCAVRLTMLVPVLNRNHEASVCVSTGADP
jgi:hypothetical protein